jgi:hypothetical protein
LAWLGLAWARSDLVGSLLKKIATSEQFLQMFLQLSYLNQNVQSALSLKLLTNKRWLINWWIVFILFVFFTGTTTGLQV